MLGCHDLWPSWLHNNILLKPWLITCLIPYMLQILQISQIQQISHKLEISRSIPEIWQIQHIWKICHIWQIWQRWHISQISQRSIGSHWSLVPSREQSWCCLCWCYLCNMCRICHMCWIYRVPGSSLDIASVDAIFVICVVFVGFVGFVGFQGAVWIGYDISLICAAFVISLAFCEFGRGWSYQVRLHCNLHFCHIRSGYEYQCNQSHVLKMLLPWRLMSSWICVEHWGHRVLVMSDRT